MKQNTAGYPSFSPVSSMVCDPDFMPLTWAFDRIIPIILVFSLFVERKRKEEERYIPPIYRDELGKKHG
jgi:hypothetical protein